MKEKCRQCGSEKIIPEVFIMDRGDSNATHPLQVRVQGKPQAWVFKDSLYGQLTARICGACGHTELRVKNPSDLYDKYLQALESEEMTTRD
jgi:hypothetical protein